MSPLSYGMAGRLSTVPAALYILGGRYYNSYICVPTKNDRRPPAEKERREMPLLRPFTLFYVLTFLLTGCAPQAPGG